MSGEDDTSLLVEKPEPTVKAPANERWRVHRPLMLVGLLAMLAVLCFMLLTTEMRNVSVPQEHFWMSSTKTSATTTKAGVTVTKSNETATHSSDVPSENTTESSHGSSLRTTPKAPDTTAPDTNTCSPKTLNASNVSYPSEHRFYSMLQLYQSALEPPVFEDNRSRILCDEEDGPEKGWKYCLPISGRKDEPFCTAPDRMDLLVPQGNRQHCFGSVLHMLLTDVYSKLQLEGAMPIVLYGTVLGAIRNGSVIPFTEDADVGYRKDNVSMPEMRQKMRDMGYHLFEDNIWRVCIAPNHPLASVLYDPTVRKVQYRIPYVDLYSMNKERNGKWRVDEVRNAKRLPAKDFEPYSQVNLNGLPFDTLAKPIKHLVWEYGKDYMVPRPRKPDEDRR
ncbi:hypothetical protein Poli38472_014744 [Pythium oligandrum]|uniref:Uncharacterized protein n=1 Tax=Pythium oligandrum TaxID=41045 RepID=A0A8K1FDK9_PYTOL|nr:hypothetical protein Poli38472_014744 [Pythium oligandrum]|eukprot:TMW54973.1 hypothetical protein Poli38472_014744 [Pythium oligandrum]